MSSIKVSRTLPLQESVLDAQPVYELPVPRVLGEPAVGMPQSVTTRRGGACRKSWRRDRDEDGIVKLQPTPKALEAFSVYEDGRKSRMDTILTVASTMEKGVGQLADG